MFCSIEWVDYAHCLPIRYQPEGIQASHLLSDDIGLSSIGRWRLLLMEYVWPNLVAVSGQAFIAPTLRLLTKCIYYI